MISGASSAAFSGTEFKKGIIHGSRFFQIDSDRAMTERSVWSTERTANANHLNAPHAQPVQKQ